MVITINNTLKLISGKKHYICGDPSMGMPVEMPSVALSSLAIYTVLLEGQGFPVNSQNDSLVYLSGVIHSPLQPHLQATKQEKITPQPPCNPSRGKAETL